jgi:preprotein translocase subunit YajC
VHAAKEARLFGSVLHLGTHRFYEGFDVNHLPILLAQAAAGPDLNKLLLMMGGMFAIMWFLVINPQRKQLKQQKEMLGSLKKGDEVVTQGGILGRIYAIDDKVITVEVAAGVKLRVLKSSVSAKTPTAVEEPAKAATPPVEKKEEK